MGRSLSLELRADEGIRPFGRHLRGQFDNIFALMLVAIENWLTIHALFAPDIIYYYINRIQYIIWLPECSNSIVIPFTKCMV